MILSVSRRTDIPTFYSDWFINRLYEGYVLTRNPMNHSQVSKIPLSPEVIDCIVFWTKDPKNIMAKLKLLDAMKYNYCFQFTVTPYGKDIERNLREKIEIEDTFLALSDTIGKERVLWRYDPIIINNRLTVNYHKEQFMRLCDKFYNHTENVTISFVDTYRKLQTNVIVPIDTVQMTELGEFIGQTAKNYGLTAKACCEDIDLTTFGIEKASCIDKAIIEKVCGYELDIKADKNQRKNCGCVESIDIGTYNTCLNGCVYCYANYSEKSIQANARRHNTKSKMLNDDLKGDEKVTERKVQLNKKTQTQLF